MISIADTADPVRHPPSSARRSCAWMGCAKQVSTVTLMCEAHWRNLPQRFKNRLARTYRVDRENRGVIVEYAEILAEIREWIKGEVVSQAVPARTDE